MTKNTESIAVAPRVAAFSVDGTDATFIGFIAHNDAKGRKGVRFMTMHAGNLVLDRSARLTQTRATGAVPGTVVSAALLDAKDIVRATFRTGAGVEGHREAISTENRLARRALKAFRSLNTL